MECLDFLVLFGCQMRQKHAESMALYHWNRLVDALLKSKRTRAALSTLRQMERSGTSPSAQTMSILLAGLAKNGRFADFEGFAAGGLAHAKTSGHVASSLLCGAAKSGSNRLLNSAHFALDCEPNLSALAVGICAAARNQNEALLSALVKKAKVFPVLPPLVWSQIVSSFGRVGNCDRMWAEYAEYRAAPNPPSLQLLATLCAMERRPDFRRAALDEAVPLFEHLSDAQSRLFWRAALSLGEPRIARMAKAKMANASL